MTSLAINIVDAPELRTENQFPRLYLDGAGRLMLRARSKREARKAIVFLKRNIPLPAADAIRHFGLLAAGHVNGRLERARNLLTEGSGTPTSPQPVPVPHTWTEILLCLLAIDVAVCPRCHARAVVRRPLPLPPPERHDTS